MPQACANPPRQPSSACDQDVLEVLHMHRYFTALLVITLCAGLGFADDVPVRTDLTPKDLARVRAVTAPAIDFTKPEQFELLPAGAATSKKIVNRDAFSFPSANLSFDQQEQFSLGNGFFRKVWVSAPSSTRASDGLGPLFNARGCQNCHLKDGRGHPPMGADDDGVSMFLRLSVPPHTDAEKQLIASGQENVISEPTYGGQLQDFAVAGLRAEGRMDVIYADLPVTLGDGTVVILRKPKYSASDLTHGPMAPDTMMSPRVAPQMIGLGLVEQIPEEDILVHADTDDKDHDGISGKPNYSRDLFSGKVMLGRFGWKAGAPTVRTQFDLCVCLLRRDLAWQPAIGVATAMGGRRLARPLLPAAAGLCRAAAGDPHLDCAHCRLSRAIGEGHLPHCADRFYRTHPRQSDPQRRNLCPAAGLRDRGGWLFRHLFQPVAAEPAPREERPCRSLSSMTCTSASVRSRC